MKPTRMKSRTSVKYLEKEGSLPGNDNRSYSPKKLLAATCVLNHEPQWPKNKASTEQHNLIPQYEPEIKSHLKPSIH